MFETLWGNCPIANSNLFLKQNRLNCRKLRRNMEIKRIMLRAAYNLRMWQDYQASILSGNKLPKKLWLLPQGIAGDSTNQAKKLKGKLHLRTFQSVGRRAAAKLKLLEDWHLLLTRLFQKQKLLAIRKLAMQAKTLPLQLKIMKVAQQMEKKKLRERQNNLKDILREKAYQYVCDQIMGDNWEGEVKQKKLKDLKDGKYKNRLISLANNEELGNQIYRQPNKFTVDDLLTVFYKIELSKEQAEYKKISLNQRAINRAENQGIVFIDQIDKLTVADVSSGPSVSRQGVQRDLLPIIEGTVVHTKFGEVKTDKIHFIASGAFLSCKQEELLPQLLGRLPVRITMQSFSEVELRRILVQPELSLLRQHQLLMQQEKIDLEFDEEAITEMAKTAYLLNTKEENTGARRLNFIVSKVMEEISYHCEDYYNTKVVIDKKYVIQRLKNSLRKVDLYRHLI